MESSAAKKIQNLPVPALPREALYFWPQHFLNELLNDLRKARRTVDIEMYIWGDDNLTRYIEKRLIELASSGVQVRLLVDAVGSYAWINSRMNEVRAKGIHVKVYKPFPGLDSLLYFFSPDKSLFRLMNRRDHRKVIIIDRKITYMGSFNMTQTEFNWRETMVRLSRPAPYVQKLFEEAWLKHRYVHVETKARATRRFVGKARLLNLIKNAQFRVWLTTPYFNPPKRLLRAIRSAARRGVDVRILLPERSDVPYLRWIAQEHYLNLLQSRIRIYEYQPTVLHAKTAIIDDVAVVGSSNLNYRSFFKDAELNILLETEEAVQDLCEQFQSDLDESRPILTPAGIEPWKQVFTMLLAPFRDSL